MIIWGIVALILILIVIGLIIWLLLRQSTTVKKNLNQSCTISTECEAGLYCDTALLNMRGMNTMNIINTINGMTGTIPPIGVCKIISGGKCNVNVDCGNGQVCNNNICSVPLGNLGQACPCANGFTCLGNICKIIPGGACRVNSDCSSNICSNNVCLMNGMTGGDSGNSGNSGHTGTNWSSCDSSNSSNNSSNNCKDSRYSYSSPPSHRKSNSSNYSDHSDSSYDSSFYTCTRTDCSDTLYSLDNSDKDKHDNSYNNNYNNNYNNKHNNKHENNQKECSSSSWNTECRSDERAIRKGVYVTNEQNQDQTLYTNIDYSIIDVAKTDKIYLLLENGDVSASSGINNIIYKTNYRMHRMVRFGNEIIGLCSNGKLYVAVKNNKTWNWEKLSNFPKHVRFMDSTNNGSYLSVQTNTHLYTYIFNGNWKNATVMAETQTHKLRFYGKDLSRYIDINEDKYIGVCNNSEKYSDIKSAAFYQNNNMTSVLVNDTFSHCRIIDNNAYFLFSC